MLRCLLLLPLALAACTGGEAPNQAEADGTVLDNAADVAATEAPAAAPTAGSAGAPTQDPQAPLTPPAPGQPGGLPDDRTPLSEAPAGADSAQAAATVVETYYALLGERRYRQAWALWADGGRASGMNARDFAASFDRYAQYRANVGAPGRVEGAAGSRYVTVPVQVYGRLRDGGRQFSMLGNVTLRRAVADGATAEQRRWHIHSSDVKPRLGRADPAPAPRPSPTAADDNRSAARYRCMDGTRVVANFDPDNRRVTVRRGGERATLRQARVASGIRYTADGYALQAKGEEMTFTAPGQPPIACRVVR